MNTINLIGNICKDIELKVTPNGKSVCSFNLAVRRPFTKDTTDFFTIVCWEKQADMVSKHCRKGDRIGVTGTLTSREYKDKDGNNRKSFEIIANNIDFCSSKGDNGQAAPSAPAYSDTNGFEELSSEDELPF
jgi:single-strand DNA-binding protein